MPQQAFPRHIPFAQELGLELWGFGDGLSELRLNVRPEHTNSYLVTHGGVLMTMMDVAMAHAARSVVDADDGPGVVTIEMKTSFMRPAQGLAIARGKLLQRTATMAFTEATIHNEAGQLCAHATGTFKYVKPPKQHTQETTA